MRSGNQMVRRVPNKYHIFPAQLSEVTMFDAGNGAVHSELINLSSSSLSPKSDSAINMSQELREVKINRMKGMLINENDRCWNCCQVDKGISSCRRRRCKILARFLEVHPDYMDVV